MFCSTRGKSDRPIAKLEHGDCCSATPPLPTMAWAKTLHNFKAFLDGDKDGTLYNTTSFLSV
jgi:hypothetical protein